MAGRDRRLVAAMLAGAIALPVLGSGVFAAEPAGVEWRPAVDVRTAEGLSLQDADSQGSNVALVWEEPASGGGTAVGLRRSSNAGDSFGAVSLFPDARQPAVDVCSGSRLSVVYSERTLSGPRNVVLLGGAMTGGFFGNYVAPSTAAQRHPDVGCAGDVDIVSWFERESSADRLYVAFRSPTLGVSVPQSLGTDDSTFFGRSLAVAGVGGMAYAAFARSDGDLRLKRWIIGPDDEPTALPTQVIANGTPDSSADGVVIAANGSHVAVSWYRCGGLFARASDDNGQTWGPTRRIESHQACDGDFAAIPSSIAIADGRVALTYVTLGIGGPPAAYLVRTTSEFEAYSEDLVATSQIEHMVGFVRTGGVTKLGAAFQRDDRIRYRRQS